MIYNYHNTILLCKWSVRRSYISPLQYFFLFRVYRDFTIACFCWIVLNSRARAANTMTTCMRVKKSNYVHKMNVMNEWMERGFFFGYSFIFFLLLSLFHSRAFSHTLFNVLILRPMCARCMRVHCCYLFSKILCRSKTAAEPSGDNMLFSKAVADQFRFSFNVVAFAFAF